MSDNHLQKYYFHFHLGVFSWLCETTFQVTVNTQNEEFFQEIKDPNELKDALRIRHAKFEETDHLNPLPEDAFCVFDRYYVIRGKERIMYRALKKEGPPYAEVHFQADGNILCRYLPAGRGELKFSSTMIDTMSLEYLLLDNDGLLLHSCFIRWHGKAILFTAPSGTGKSTQGDLWVKYRGAEVINGDRSGVLWDGTQWIASGLPYAGSSRVYRNENAPIRVIVYLAQGPVNEIRRLSAVEAFRLMYPEIMIHHWEIDFVNTISDRILKLLAEIPVYYLSCTPDVGAVEALEQVLD